MTVAMASVGLKLESEGTYERNTENVENALDSIFVKDPQAIVMIGTYAVRINIKINVKQANLIFQATCQIRKPCKSEK